MLPGRVQKRHQMNIIDMAGFQIGEFLLHTFQITGKIVNVKHHAEHIIPAKPTGIFLPLFIPCLKLSFPLFIKPVKVRTQLRKHGIIMIQLHIKPSQLVVMFREPLLKNLICF